MPARNPLGARLRAERELRGWSREQLARRMITAARRPLPDVPSLVHMIKEWERGKHRPGPRNRPLYAAVLGIDEHTLFGPVPPAAGAWNAGGSYSPDDQDRLEHAMARPGRVDAGAVDALAGILAGLRRLEDATGATPVLHTVQAQMPVVQGLVTEARGSLRPALVDVAAQWNQFAGWLNIATGNMPGAHAALDRAAEHAEETGDAEMIGTVMSWRAYLAGQLGQLGPMIGMAHAAQRNRRGPGQAYDLFLEARGHAVVEEPAAARNLLAAARQAAGDAQEADARPWEYYYLEPGFFVLETGLVHLYLGRTDPRDNAHAVEMFTTGLEELPAGMRQSDWAGLYVLRLATAHVQAQDAEAACTAFAEAVSIARATGSVSLLAKCRELHQRMRHLWPDHPAVMDLLDVLR